MARLTILARRLLAAIPVLLGVSLLTFLIVDRLPGNAAEQMTGGEATAQQVTQLEERLQLNRPVWNRYLEWLWRTLRGDLGDSVVSGQRVSRMLRERIPVSVELLFQGL